MYGNNLNIGQANSGYVYDLNEQMNFNQLMPQNVLQPQMQIQPPYVIPVNNPPTMYQISSIYQTLMESTSKINEWQVVNNKKREIQKKNKNARQTEINEYWLTNDIKTNLKLRFETLSGEHYGNVNTNSHTEGATGAIIIVVERISRKQQHFKGTK